MVRRNPSNSMNKPISSWHVFLFALSALNSITGTPLIKYQPTNQTPQQTQTLPTNPLITSIGDMPRGGREEPVTQLKDVLNAIEKPVELPGGLGTIKIDFHNPYSLLLYIVFAVIPAIKTKLNESKQTAKVKEAKKALEKIEEQLKEYLGTSSAKLLIDYHKRGQLKNQSDVFALVGSYHYLQNLSIELSDKLSAWLDKYRNALEDIEQVKEMSEIIDSFKKVSKLPLDQVDPEKLKRDLDNFVDELRRLTEKK